MLHSDWLRPLLCAHDASLRAAQAQLKVTTLRLKEKTAEFLRSYTPLVFDAIKEYVTRQQQMLQECSAAFAGLTDNKLGGMRAVRAKRVDIEVRLLQCACFTCPAHVLLPVLTGPHRRKRSRRRSASRLPTSRGRSELWGCSWWCGRATGRLSCAVWPRPV